MVLRVDKVDLVRDRRLLLDEVTMTVNEGEHWALLGPNGAGKSTLLGILGAYTHPTRGQAEILGHRLGRVNVFELRPLIGQVDPRHPLESARTVREVVLTGVTGTIELVPRWTPSEAELRRAGELIELMGLAAGPADAVLTTDLVSECFDHPITITRSAGRWAATAGTRRRGR